MAYVTSTQIVDRLGASKALQLTTDSGDTVDTDLITMIIAEVEGRIDQAVRVRTSTTITQSSHPKTFAMLRGYAVAMTIYGLAARRPPVAEDWKNANDQAVAWLEKLAKGEVELPDVALGTDDVEHGSMDQNAADWR